MTDLTRPLVSYTGVFSTVVLEEPLRWQDFLAFGLILSGVIVGIGTRHERVPVVAPTMSSTPPETSENASEQEMKEVLREHMDEETAETER